MVPSSIEKPHNHNSIQNTTNTSKLLQGEMLALRLPPGGDEWTTAGAGLLLFDDGAGKGLAAFIVWCALVALCGDVTPADLDSQSRGLITSLMKIPSMFKAKATLSRADNVIANIAKQDADSKAQPVSSFLWSSILRSLCEGGVKLSYQDAIAKYNSHPDVVAYCKEGDAIDKKKGEAIKHWFEQCGDEARKVVEDSQHNIPFAQGPFGEQLSALQCLFVGSSANLSRDTSCALSPLDGEVTVDIDWGLTLGPEGQAILFRHIVSRFDVDTALVPDEKKKKYRATQDDLMPIRHQCALFMQLQPFLASKLSGDTLTEMRKELERHSGSQDMQFVLDNRPGTFALSMLPSQRTTAQKHEEEREQRKTLTLESKRVEVQASQWSFFKEALAADQEKLAAVQKAPRKLQDLKHLKAVQWRKGQERQAQQAVQGYAENHIRVMDCSNTAACVKETSDFIRHIVFWL